MSLRLRDVPHTSIASSLKRALQESSKHSNEKLSLESLSKCFQKALRKDRNPLTNP